MYDIPENPVVSNVQVYGMAEAIAASKYPFATDISSCSYAITKTVKALAHAPKGSGEDNFLKGINVHFDLNFTNKAWVEIERYHFIDIISSQSTMHCITKFDLKKQCNEYVDQRIIDILQEKVNAYNANPKSEEAFYEMMYNIPSGFRLTARITTNYQQLKTIYSQRRYHRLKKDWGCFCDFIETLPLSYLITGKDPDNAEG